MQNKASYATIEKHDGLAAPFIAAVVLEGGSTHEHSFPSHDAAYTWLDDTYNLREATEDEASLIAHKSSATVYVPRTFVVPSQSTQLRLNRLETEKQQRIKNAKSKYQGELKNIDNWYTRQMIRIAEDVRRG